jgi:uncharacterized OsmC-like protein
LAVIESLNSIFPNKAIRKMSSIVLERQQALIDSYLADPKKALVTDEAIVEGRDFHDPFHTEVSINDELNVPFKIGIHRAVGGLHDFPNPGDMLCASLAACFDCALRLIANRMNVSIIKTSIKARANADVRGTLMVDREVPVGFQSMELDVLIECDSSVNEKVLGKLVDATESCCIIYQTLKPSLPIHINRKFTFVE